MKNITEFSSVGSLESPGGMHRGRRVALKAIVTIALAGLSAIHSARASGPTEWAKGRLLVMPRAGLPAGELDKIVRVHGGVARRIGQSNLHVVELPASASEVAVQAQLAHNPHLKFAELDYKVSPTLTVNDPYASSAWQLPIIKANLAWDFAMGSGVTIAILDSGVLGTHQDLAANLVSGRNTYDGSGATGDVTGHGTAVAGAAAAAANNTIGVAGIAGSAKVMPIRITDSSGLAYYSTIASGITYAADNGVRVVNCSYGYLFKTASIQSAGSYLKSKGGLLIVSAGNNGIDENAPATSSMITVSATDSSDQRAGWSSYGSMVSLSAPGVGIWTTSSDGTYRTASGTSFSSPIVAGVAALVMSANPALSSSQVESLLFSTATDLGAAGKDIYYGYGRVDAYAAVQAAKGTTNNDSQAPSVWIASPTAGSTVTGIAQIDVAASDNVGVTKVELRVNGTVIASDTVAPFNFSWDTAQVGNGSANLTATAYDAAGNSRTSSSTSLNVANESSGTNIVADTTPPVVTISNPGNGASIVGNVTVTAVASDNGGSTGIRQSLYIDGVLKASGSGSSLTYKWNTRKTASGTHKIEVVAQDVAGNRSASSVAVSK